MGKVKEKIIEKGAGLIAKSKIIPAESSISFSTISFGNSTLFLSQTTSGVLDILNKLKR